MVETPIFPANPSAYGISEFAVPSASTILRLRSWTPVSSSKEPVATVGGVPLPSFVGRAEAGPTRILCVAPDDWLLVSATRSADATIENIEADAQSQGLVCVNLTDAFAVLQLWGRAARDLLSKGCGLDMHPRHFLPGQCARTRLAQIPVLVDCVEALPRFALIVPRSYQAYLNSWISHFDPTVVRPCGLHRENFGASVNRPSTGFI